MTYRTASNPSRILRTGFAALILAVVFFWSGRTFGGFAGFAFTMAFLACGAVGLGLVIAQAMEVLSKPERRTAPAAGRRASAPGRGYSAGRCGICNQRRVLRSGLVVCLTCDRHLIS